MRSLEPGAELDDALTPYLDVDRTPVRSSCWVLANMVAGLDGSASVDGRAGGLSSPADRALFKRLRSLADVVLVGASTVRREGYGPVRVPEDRRAARIAEGRPPSARLAIVSRSLDLDYASAAFTEADPEAPTMVVTGQAADPVRTKEAAEVAEVVIAGDEQVEPAAALAALAERGARVVLCEGGPALLGELVEADVVDELCLTLSPVMGGDPLPVAVSSGGRTLAGFSLGHALVHDDALFLRYQRSDDVSRDGR